MRCVSAFALGLAVVAAAGCGDAPSPSGLQRVEAPIIGGTPDPGETGTVYISHIDYPFLCSGTVIGPTLVVTAKHCTFRERSGDDQPLAGDRFRVGFGPDQSQLQWRGTTRMEWIGMPGNLEVQPSVDAGEDVALLWLSSAVPAGTNIHGVKLDYAPAVGDGITIVGYGRSSLTTNAAGVKRVTVDQVEGWEAATGILQTKGKGACSGDSGGSFYFGSPRELVGVTSTAGGSSDTQFCDVGITQASSVLNPRVSQFLSDALASLGVCSPRAETCGNGADEDCDGIADNQCKNLGESCATQVDCASGVCADLGAGTVCARPCDDDNPCPSGSRCVADCIQGYCEPGNLGTTGWTGTCSADADCSTNHCSSSGCSARCNPLLGQCPDEMACSTASGCGECLPLGEVSGPRQLGERCSADADCAEGSCEGDGFGISRCAGPCLEGGVCPDGLRCKGDLCLRTGGLSDGERCTDPIDCASQLCAVFGDVRKSYCTRLCETHADCGNNLECRDELGHKHCVPASARLGEDCVQDSQCVSGSCDTDRGVCTRRCDPAGEPCPVGFFCQAQGGELRCVAGPNAFDPPGGGGSGGSGGSSTGGAGSGGVGASAGQAGGAGAPLYYAPANEKSGCACRVGAPARGTGLWGALALGLMLGWRRRRR